MKLSAAANSVVLAVAIIATILVTGLAQINFQHHLNLPSELKNKNVIEVVNPLIPFTGRTIHIRLSEELKGVDTVRDVGKVLQEATSRDTVVLHIHGYGGEAQTCFYLINNIKATKAKTVAIVEAPSYSAHAYIASSTDKLIMEDLTYLMFHTTSGYGKDCSKEKGTDRTVSNVEHCQLYLDNHLYQTHKMIESVKFLTPEEKAFLMTGHDVYITAEEYTNRVH